MPASTILVCDDEPALRLLVRLAIEPKGYRIFDAQDGEGCLALAARICPGLVILDMNLPDMRGTDVINGMREIPALASTAILVATGSTAPSEQAEIEQLGVDGVLIKPFSLDALVAHVDRLLGPAAASATRSPWAPATPAAGPRPWRQSL